MSMHRLLAMVPQFLDFKKGYNRFTTISSVNPFGWITLFEVVSWSKDVYRNANRISVYILLQSQACFLSLFGVLFVNFSCWHWHAGVRHLAATVWTFGAAGYSSMSNQVLMVPAHFTSRCLVNPITLSSRPTFDMLIATESFTLIPSQLSQILVLR